MLIGAGSLQQRARDRAAYRGVSAKGEWRAMQPPGHPESTFDSWRLREIVKSTSRQVICPGCSACRVLKKGTAGGPVYAPFDGEVVQVREDLHDRTKINLIKNMLLTMSPALAESATGTTRYSRATIRRGRRFRQFARAASALSD